MSDNCSHNEIEPYGDGSWGRCKLCGDDSFPITAEAAGMCSYCGAYCGYHKKGCPLEDGNEAKEKAWAAYLAGVASRAKAWCPDVIRQEFEEWWEKQ